MAYAVFLTYPPLPLKHLFCVSVNNHKHYSEVWSFVIEAKAGRLREINKGFQKHIQSPPNESMLFLKEMKDR
jgi:hypothetical protein